MGFSYVTCSGCNKDFLKENRYVHENIKLHNKFYCSSECLSNGRLKRVELICDLLTCKKRFYRTPSEISPHNFCSHSCSAAYTNPRRVRIKFSKQTITRSYNRRLSPLDSVKTCLFCNKLFYTNRTYCSIQCWADDHTLSKEQLLSNIKEKAGRLGRSPTRREFSQYTSCVRSFGSWSNALVQAGLQPNRSLNQRMYKRRICFAHDGHICNSVSEMIVDNWLYEHAIPHQKEVPYPVGNSVADWMIGTDILVEYFGLAKDSRRYDLAIEKKRRVCKEAGVRLIEIFSNDLFPTNNLSKVFKRVSVEVTMV